MQLLQNNIGYIKILNFEDSCADGFIEAVHELEKYGRFVIYIRRQGKSRRNSLTSFCVSLIFCFLKAICFISRDKQGNERIETSDAANFKSPMAVLIDANSYSAAEFFAAVLSEYQWAEIIGEQSTGKARSQQTFEFSDGSAIHLSTNAYLTPGRVDLSEAGGVKPDIEVKAASDTDNQLSAAIEFLLGMTGTRIPAFTSIIPQNSTSCLS